MQPFYQGDRRRDLDNFGPRARLRLDEHARAASSSTAAGASTTTASRSRSSRSSAASTAARCRSRCGPATCSSSIPRRARCRPSRRPSPTPSPASSCPAPAPRASTSSTTRSRTRRCSSSTWGRASRLPGDAVLQLDLVHNRGTHFIIGRPIGEVFNPVVGGPDRVVNLESSVGTRYDALLASLEKRWGGGQQLRAVLHAWRAPATTRTTTRSPSAPGPIDPNDLEREYGPTPERAAPPPRAVGLLRCCRSSCGSRGIWTIASGVPMDILMPDALAAACPRCRATPAGASSRPPPSSTPTSPALNAERRDRRRAAAARARRRPLQRRLRLARPAPLAALRGQRVARASRRSSSASTSSTSRTSSASRKPTTRASRTCSRATAPSPADPGFLRSSSFGQRAHDRGRRLRLRRPARLPARPEGAVLSAGGVPGLQRRIGLPRRRGARRGRDGRRRDLPHARPGWRARSPRPALVFLVWAFMGAAALCGALSLGELAARYPEAGGAYVYLREAYGPARGVPVRLEVPARDGPRAHRGARDGPRRLRAGDVARRCRRRPWRSSRSSLIAAANVLGRAPRRRRSATCLAARQDRAARGARGVGLRLGRGRRVALRRRSSRGVPARRRSCRRSPGAFVLAFFSFGGWWEAAKLAGEVRDPRRALPARARARRGRRDAALRRR